MVRVDNSEFWTMYMCTVRYSLGRMTAMPSVCLDLYNRYKASLTRHQKNQVREEIQAALFSAENRGVFLGMRMDHQTWNSLVLSISLDLDGTNQTDQ